MKYLLPLVALLISACHTVPSVPPPPQANAAELLQATQFRTPLLYLQAPLYDPELQEWIPQQFIDEVLASIQGTVDNPYTDYQLQQVLSKKLNGVEMQQVIDFYKSPSGQAILAAESGFRETINTHPSKDTLVNTDQLLQATKLADTLNSIFMASADALINRLDSYDCLAIMQIPGSHIGLNIAKRNKANFMQRQIRRSLAKLYSRVSLADLQAYQAFAESPVGQRYFAARTEAMTTIGQDFGERVAEAIAPGLPSCVGSLKLSPGVK